MEKPPSEAKVVMYEVLMSQHCDEDGTLDVGHLLRWADLATCASAEAHSGTNCVTVAVSDLCFEPGVTARCADVVEVSASPAAVGRTSLDIKLLVHVENRTKGTRIALCSASFTYVTVKAADGSKQFCPPLRLATEEERLSEQLEKERKKMKVKEVKGFSSATKATSSPSQRSANPVPVSGSGDKVFMAATAVQMTELVLPQHSNHMGNTFGGQVMAWMHKAARVVIGRHIVRSRPRSAEYKTASVSTLAVEAIEFPAASQSSDHLVFDAMIHRIFQPNQLAINVSVAKRQINEGSRLTHICRGMFHFAVNNVDGGVRLLPVEPEPDDEEARSKFVAAENRRDVLLARTEFLSFHSATAPRWISSLTADAARMTIEVVLRMLRAESVHWEPVSTGTAEVSASCVKEAWGQPITVVRFDVSLEDVPASKAFAILQKHDQRSKWDRMCKEYVEIEAISATAQLMRLVLRVPLEIASGFLGLLGRTCVPSPENIFTVLRSVQADQSGGGVIASRSVDLSKTLHTMQSQAACGPGGGSKVGVVLPSGWLVSSKKTGGCELSYMVTMEDFQVKRFVGDDIQPLCKFHAGSLKRLMAMCSGDSSALMDAQPSALFGLSC